MTDYNAELSWTGERYVPQLKGIIALEHLHRYAMATEYVQGKRVLDIASGEGYGSEMLARRAVSVVGVDIDEASVAHAQKKYQKENLIFKQGSCTDIPLPDHSIDAVVSFETIEHIEEHEKMFSEIKRVLTPGGILIISSPEKHEYTEVPEHYNEFHVKELYYDEFEKLLNKFFKNHSILGQRVLYGSGIFNLNRENSFGGFYKFDNLPHQLGKRSGLPHPLYLIALCSDEMLLKSESTFCEQSVIEAGPHQELENVLKETKQQLLNQEYQLEEQSLQLEEKEKQLREKDLQLHEQAVEMKQQEETISSLQTQVEIFTASAQEKVSIEPDMPKIFSENREITLLRSFANRIKKFWNSKRAVITINKSRLFEREWYLKQNPDVAASGMDPLLHYINFGEQEGRNPHPLFNATWYLNNYLDVRNSRTNALYHYVKYGWKEGRKPSSLFDGDWYLEQHPELIAGGENPLFHYLQQGKSKNSDSLKRAMTSSSMDDYVRKNYGPQNFLHLENISKSLYAAISPQESVTCHALEMLKKGIRESSIASATEAYSVSIIIPVHNQLPYTLACVATILKSEIKGSFEIIIADDASTDETFKTFENLHPAIKVVRHVPNLGFLKNCNETAKQAQGEYILLLNNDTLVLPGWVDALVNIFKMRSDAGLVGAKLLNADGTLQEAGGIIWKDGSGCNYGRNDDPEKSEYNYVREVDYCSGACIMIPKKLWEQLEGFDPLFSPAYCEDSDLAFRVRAVGKKVYYQPKSEVIHLEGKSHGKDVKQGIKSYQVENNKKLFQRWKTALSKHAAPGKNVFQQRDRAFNKKTILIIDHYLPQYDKDAGARTIWSYIKFFVGKGFVVKFLGDTFITSEPYYTELQQMGVEVLYNEPSNQHWKNWLKENGKYIDYVFLSRAHIAVQYVNLLRKQTHAKLLFYGHDLLSRTFSNKHHLFKDIFALAKSKKWKKLEDTIINQVDVTFYPSHIEVEYLKKCYPHQSIKLLPPYVLPHQQNKGSEKHSFNGKLLFVGGFNHPPNVEAVLWFMKKIWPSIVAIFPKIEFTIAGSNPPKEILQLANEQVHVTGFISDQKLIELYRTHDIVIVPLLTGGGIKNKVIEALWHEKPVLTTPIGAEGIPSIQEYVNIAEPADFFTSLKKLIESPEELSNFSKNASELIGKYYSEEALYSVLSEDIDFS